MATVSRTVLVFGALLAAVWAPANASAQTNLRYRVANAVQTIESACGKEIAQFCSTVSPGEGRLLLCMQAHEDKLGIRCEFALYRVSRRLEHALHRVERIADACWNDIQKQCGDEGRIGRCVVQKRDSLSRSCRTVVAGLQQAVQGVAALAGLPAYSSDDKDLGQVVQVARGPDGKIHSVQVEVGRFLGLGNKIITITADKFEQLADRIRLRIDGDQVRALPDAMKQ